MASRTVCGKSVKAYLLAGILAFLITCDFFTAEYPGYFNDGDNTSLVSVTQAITLLRDAGTESLSNLPAAKILTFGYPVVPYFELIKKEAILKSSLRVNAHVWNVFYVHITHQAP